jgi:hypothetical protein
MGYHALALNVCVDLEGSVAALGGMKTEAVNVPVVSPLQQ